MALVLSAAACRNGVSPRAWMPAAMARTSRVARAGQLRQVGPGSPGVVAARKGGERGHVATVAGRVAMAPGEVGVRAGERGPGRVVEHLVVERCRHGGGARPRCSRRVAPVY